MRPIKAKIPRRVIIGGDPWCTTYEESDLEKIWPGGKDAYVINLHTMDREYVWNEELRSWIPTPKYRDIALEW